MSHKLRWVYNRQYQLQENIERVEPVLQNFTVRQVNRVEQFHRTYDGFEKTPLRSLDFLASHIGVNKIFMKDESFRFGLKF